MSSVHLSKSEKRILKRRGTWNAIVAMRRHIQDLEDQNARLVQALTERTGEKSIYPDRKSA